MEYSCRFLMQKMWT